MSKAMVDLARVLGRGPLAQDYEKRRAVNMGITGPSEAYDRVRGGFRSLSIPQASWPPVSLILGTTGCGKSYLFASILMQMAIHKQGFFLVDPTGSIHRVLVDFFSELLLMAEVMAVRAKTSEERDRHLRWVNFIKEKVMILDFSGESYPLDKMPYRYNPLYYDAKNGETPETAAKRIKRSFTRLIGDMTQMRRLSNVLGCTSAFVSEERGTFQDILEIIRMSRDDFDKRVIRLHRIARDEGRSRPFCEYQIQMIYELIMETKGRERRDLVQSTMNALGVVLEESNVRQFVSCRGDEPDAINHYDIVNNGKIVLCHFPQKDRDFCQVMGNLNTVAIEQVAFSRAPRQRNNLYFLAVDELAMVADQGFAEASGIIRQFGLRLLVAMQHSQQPPFGTSTEGQATFDTIASQADLKVLFRLSITDAETFAPYIHRARGETRCTEYFETTVGESVVLGQETTQRMGIEFQRGMDESFGIQRSHDQRLSIGLDHSCTYEIGESEEHSFAHSKEQQNTETVGLEERKTQSDETGRQRSRTRTTNREVGQTQTVGNEINRGNKSVKKTVRDEQRGYSHQHIDDWESGNNRTTNNSRTLRESHGESITEVQTRAFKTGQETAHTTSSSTSLAVGVQERRGESIYTAEGRRNTRTARREEGFEQSQTLQATQKQSSALKKGRDVSESKQNGVSVQTRQVGGFLSHDADMALAQQRLYLQSDQEAYVVQKPVGTREEGKFVEADINVVRIKTHTVNHNFMTALYDRNLKEEFVEATRSSILSSNSPMPHQFHPEQRILKSPSESQQQSESEGTEGEEMARESSFELPEGLEL